MPFNKQELSELSKPYLKISWWVSITHTIMCHLDMPGVGNTGFGVEESKSILRHSIFGEIKKWFPDAEGDPPTAKSFTEVAVSAIKGSNHLVSQSGDHSDQFQTLICCRSLRISLIPEVSEQLKLCCLLFKMPESSNAPYELINLNCGWVLCASLWCNSSELELQPWIPYAATLTSALSSEKFPSSCHFPSL